MATCLSTSIHIRGMAQKTLPMASTRLYSSTSLKRKPRGPFSTPSVVTNAWWSHDAHPRPNCVQPWFYRRAYVTVIEDEPPTTGKPKFPFPAHPNPSAHEIFHLHRAATPAEIKKRYYELVRYHHPDSHHCRCLPNDKAHAQFQRITAAYDYLRGVTSSHLPNAKRYGFNPGQSNFDPYLHELARRRRAQQAAQDNRGYGPHNGPSGGDDFDLNGRKELSMLAFGLAALILGLYPSFVLFPFQLDKTHRSAVHNLSQARRDAREMGEERRTGIRKRVQSMLQERMQEGRISEPATANPVNKDA